MQYEHTNQIAPEIDRVLVTYLESVDAGNQIDPRNLIAEHPQWAEELRSFFAAAALVDRMAGPRAGSHEETRESC